MPSLIKQMILIQFSYIFPVAKNLYGQDINRKKNVMRQHVFWTDQFVMSIQKNVEPFKSDSDALS
jgi:hypothetical protein